MKLKIEKTKSFAEAEWKITVALAKEERQTLQKLLSIDTDAALQTFKNGDEFQIAQATDGEFTAILTVYPYPDLDQIYTPQDNGYGVVAILHKDYEFEKEYRICKRECEMMEKNSMAIFDYPYAYTITNLITNEVEYGRLSIR